jgi:hypothetical protein
VGVDGALDHGNVGTTVGTALYCLVDGVKVGTFVGVRVGRSEGLKDGAWVGGAVGVKLGKIVNSVRTTSSTCGVAVGAKDGTAVGESDGVRDGVAEGTDVGRLVDIWIGASVFARIMLPHNFDDSHAPRHSPDACCLLAMHMENCRLLAMP